MGVPAFYRWLSEKYPKIVEDVLEERVHLVHESGTMRAPFDSTKPNPSGLECDNLYIDMNGIIHPCSHPEHGPQPKNEQEMYENVCRYVDRLFRAVRPRKMLYLAVDGVAPRAKMNQQRSRRFRSAQEVREHLELERDIKQSLIRAGAKFDSADEATSKPWDSNVITPGTKFMIDLSNYIRFYIRKRISTDKAWKQIRVIFSDASIPGEGEHKVINHIRCQRSQKHYNPNQVHILHGLDADLIMLALATHEPHFYILREEVVFGRMGMQRSEQRKEESGFADAQRRLDEDAGSVAMELLENKVKPLQRISIPILREYLANEFRICNRVPFKEVSFERLIDDIVFLCFFVGNDFLPHLPSLDIRDGALDYLFNVYKRILPTLGDYITNHGGEVNLSHVDVILAEVGSIEDYIFAMKHENEQKEKERKEEHKERKKLLTKDGQAPLAEPPGGKHIESIPKVRGRAARILEGGPQNQSIANPKNMTHGSKTHIKSVEENDRAAQELKKSLKGKNKKKSKVIDVDDDGDQEEKKSIDIIEAKRKADKISTSEEKGMAEKDSDIEELFGDASDDDSNDDDNDNEDSDFETEEEKAAAHNESKKLLKLKLKEAEQKKLNSFAENVEDNVRLHEPGWKDRYYSDKCKAHDVAENGGREHLFRSYIMGLCWVMKYYYDGCPSWTWYFPFHYAPFASDLKNIERFAKDCQSFELCEPFKPVEQLMAVLPEDSSHAIPKAARWLMSDVESPIIDFYPKDVKCDPNGKAMPWLWVVLLPFIDEDRLLSAMKPTMKKWSKKELLCNARGMDDGYVFIHVTHPLASALLPALESSDNDTLMSIEKLARPVRSEICGLLRKPLSNEVYPIDEAVSVKPPKSARKIDSGSWDNLFSESIETNAALCAAFSEPNKGPHLSVLLQGVSLLDPILCPEDKRIRRPRLNRGGATIANMGGHNSRDGQSHQVGYGSMNISSYERDLAQRTGRGNQMNQAGTRAWGAMEPTQKRTRYDSNNNGNNGYNSSYNQQYNQQYRPTLFQQPSNSSGYNHGYNQSSQQGHSHHNNSRDYRSTQQNQGNRWQHHPNSQYQQNPHMPRNGYPQQQQGHFEQRQRQQNTGRQNYPAQQWSQNQQNQQRQGYSFQGHNQRQYKYTHNSHTSASNSRNDQQQKQQKTGSKISSNLMNSLRSQLASTLKESRRNEGPRGGR